MSSDDSIDGIHPGGAIHTRFLFTHVTTTEQGGKPLILSGVDFAMGDAGLIDGGATISVDFDRKFPLEELSLADLFRMIWPLDVSPVSVGACGDSGVTTIAVRFSIPHEMASHFQEALNEPA